MFLSGGVDRCLHLCQCISNGNTTEVKVLHSFKDSEASIVCCDGLVVSPDVYLIVSAAGDSLVRVYRVTKGYSKAVQTIRFGTGFVLSIHMIALPDIGVPLMACAGDDMKIHIFAWQNDQFEKVISLPGHEDWIRGLEFTIDDRGDVLLASCSQDCFVRLWRIAPFEASEKPTDKIKLKERLVSVAADGNIHKYSLVVETVLYGHQGWVYGVHWHPPLTDTQGACHQPMRMLTASMDKTMIIWEPDKETGVWEEKLRVGEVGGNTLGLYGCQFGPDGNTILAHGYQGAFTVWNRSTQSDGEQWSRGVAVGGHFGEVTDVAWDPDGEFVISTSSDQTTRLFAPWKQTQNWHEMGRPQVHGYDLQCLAMLGRSSFASGADEKVVRIFRCPANFLQNLQNLSNVRFDEELSQRSKIGESMAQGASVPALGLSNKAVFQGKAIEMYEDRELPPTGNDQYSESAFRPLELQAPPSEDNLLQNTLWPETSKLYGHGFEIFALAANPQGTILASACKATKAEYAGIILWDTRNWQQLKTLECHSLTVVQMAFSHVGDRLLSVARDRTWALHEFNYTTGSVDKIAFTDKKTAVHTRIIWSCCWTFDDVYFLTASRDKKVVFWGKSDKGESGNSTGTYEACCQSAFNQAVTAVSVAPVQDVTKQYLVGVGLESGEIRLCSWSISAGLMELNSLDISSAHHLTVKRLQFRPKVGSAGGNNEKNVLQLASCGQDQQLKIHEISVTC
ncbi:elongator complex protein 2-like [Watersipora subatra]|uniref:elongator complex protein 2-like n=1 Tax=Watersipora subatra TaxID=2589382 RepID=UPI00355BA283